MSDPTPAPARPAASPTPQVYLGVDIGKSRHYAVAVDASGQVVQRVSVPNEEAALQEVVGWARTQSAALVVDQPGGTAALLLHLSWQAGVPVAYLHGLAMARAREFYPGEGKSDPKDAFVLADTARAHPSRLAWLTPTPEVRAQLALLLGHDADLQADRVRLVNRLRALLSTYWPSLEAALGDDLDTRPILALLRAYPSGPALARAEPATLAQGLQGAGGRRAAARAARLSAAARAQTVVVAGADTAATLVAELVGQLQQVVARRRTLAQEIEQAFFTLPEAPILVSLPGIGPRLGATILVELGDVRRFRSPAHLAAYAGLGPAPHQSGSARRTTRTRHRGNQRLKQACFQGAFCCYRHHPQSQAYYARKRTEGKTHTQALLCLARRRIDVLHAMLTHRTPYAPPTAEPAVVAA